MGIISCECIAIGSLGKLLSESTGSATPRTFNESSIRHEFVYETLGTVRQPQHTNAINGSISRYSSGSRERAYMTQGSLGLQASPNQFTHWLPKIFGGPISGTDIALNDILPRFDMLVFRDNAIVQYTNCVVAQAMLRGRSSNGGQNADFIEMIINVVGEQELIDQVSWPDPEPELGMEMADLPYIFPEATLRIDNVVTEMESFQLSINNNLAVKFFGEMYPTCIRATRRDLRLDVVSPFTCDNIDASLASHNDFVTGSLGFAMANMSTLFQFPAMRNTFKTPTIEGPQDIPLEFSFEALRTATDEEVTITHDADNAS